MTMAATPQIGRKLAYKRAQKHNETMYAPASAWPPQGALAALMNEWQQEDETDDPAELERREEALQALQAGLNASREENGERRVF